MAEWETTEQVLRTVLENKMSASIRRHNPVVSHVRRAVILLRMLKGIFASHMGIMREKPWRDVMHHCWSLSKGQEESRPTGSGFFNTSDYYVVVILRRL